jgi:hypothetical protein
VAFELKPGGWFRAGEPEIDPFYLGQALDELEQRIADAIGTSSESTVYGNDFIGDLGGYPNLNINHTILIPVTFPGPGTITLEVYADGNQGGAGVVNLKGAVYDGTDTDSVRVSQGTPISISDGDAPGWLVIGENMQVNSGEQAIGYAVGGTNGVGRIYANSGPLGSSYYNNDTYSDGLAGTFGSSTTDTNIPSIRATFTPIPSAAIGGMTVQNQGTQVGTEQAATTINVSGALVSLDLASGVATITVIGDGSGTSGGVTSSYVLGNFPLPADAIVESDPLVASSIAANVVGDQNFASLYVEDSQDGVTWRTRASGGTTPALYMNATGVSSWPLMRAIVTNDSTDQTDFQFELSVTT